MKILFLLGLIISLISPAFSAEEIQIKTPIAKDDFDKGLSQWVIEQQAGGTVKIIDDALDINDAKGCTMWFKKKLKGAVVIEYEATLIKDGGPYDRVSDLNCFWMATDPKNLEDIFADKSRGGSFANYDKLQLYYVGYGANKNTTTRFRRYPGNGERPCLPEHDLRDPRFLHTPNKKLHIQIIANGKTIQYWRNGEIVFDVHDESPFSEGWFGFRTVKNHLKIDNFRVYQLKKAQTEEVSIEIQGKLLKGLLTKPIANKKRIALIHAGSGPTNRDGNTLGIPGANNCLKYISDTLVINGINTLRIDKRGVGASSNAAEKEADLRFSTYVNDTKAWIQFLKKRGYEEIILIGHSEGALVATMAAIENPAVNKLICLAGVGEPFAETLRKQLKRNAPQLFDQCDKIISSLEAGQRVDNIPQSLTSLFRPSVQPYLISSFQLDPAKEISKIKIPVLILQGITDLQTSIDGAKRLHEHSQTSHLKIIPAMNHVLKETEGKDRIEQLPSYVNPEHPLHPALGPALIEFIVSKS